MKQVKLMQVKLSMRGKEELDEFINEKMITENSNYMVNFYEIYRGYPIAENEVITDIIKVSLDIKNGLQQLLNGIKYNGFTYKELLTTPSGQKQESDETKGESFFYNADKLPNFREEFCEAISANRLQTLENKEIAINKQVSSRLALAHTSIEGAIDIDINKICVVNEYDYEYLNKYSWFENGELVEGERALTHTFSDGQGLMSNELAERIRKGLDKDYKIDFAVVRFYHGLAIKGVLLRYDFKSYFKSKGFNTITDIYGKCWNVDDIDMIVNGSMIKWLELHNNITDTTSYYQDSKYKEINNKLYILKVNKDEKKIKDYLKLNYQALLNMNLSFSDLKELAKNEVESYKNITSFNDVDIIRLALGCEDDNSVLGTIIDKLGSTALNLSYVRLLVKSTLEKQIKQLSGGKIRAKGGYKIIATDPIAFCNRIIDIETKEELQAGEFIVGGNEEGKRCVYRSPIAVYSEIHQISLSTRNWAKDYTKEIIFVNSKDDMLMRSSGADLDGDAYAVFDNEILYNACISCEFPFFNEENGNVVKMVYNHENYCKAIISSCGNLIGKIANNNAKLSYEVSSYSQIVNKSGETRFYKEIKDWWVEKHHRKNPYDKLANKEEFDVWETETNNLFKDFLSRNYTRVKDYSEEERKELIKNSFYRNRVSFFKILLASQQVIDMPKTLLGISKELKKELNDISRGLYKPYLMLNLDKATEEEVNKFHREKFINPIDCALDEYCHWIETECLYPLRNCLKTDGGSKGNKTFYSLFGDINGAVDERLYSEYKKNNKNREEATAEGKKSIDSLTLLKLMNLNLNGDTIASTGYAHKMSPRFLITFFGNLLTQKLNSMQSLTDEIVEDSNGSIYWKGKFYSKKTRDLDAELDYEIWLKEQVKRGIIARVRVFNQDGIENIDYDEVQVINGYIDNLEIKEGKKGEGVIADGVYKVIQTSIDKKGTWGTIFVIL